MTAALRRVSRPFFIALLTFRTAAGQTAAVAPADLSKLTSADFRDDEQDLPYYLAHFHRVANSVALSGPRRGFIDLVVWRNPVDNQPHNARIMENILSLAFFYATDRPWNPYRGDPNVRARLEAALDFWTRSQSADGRFSEYAPERWGLAPTAFATKFMGETLRLLHDGPPVDPALHRRAIEADRRAIWAALTRPDLYEHGRRFSNQYSNVWAGALAYLALYPDADIQRELRGRLEQAASDHQSPAGYFYEADGPDWGYNLNTHHSNFHMAWHYARGSDLAGELVEPMRRWYEWLGYNAVPEPTGRALTLNRSIETRQRRSVVAGAGPAEGEIGLAFAEHVEAARILAPTREELAQHRAQRRTELERQWPRVEPLAVGEFRAFSPYAFLHRNHVKWYPTDEQRRAAIARLPCLARDRFTHQRADTRKPAVYTYVRRPAYYAAFNAGEVLREQQRYGLGLLWTPEAGSLLQSQTGSGPAAWGTRAGDSALVYEARSITVAYRVDGVRVTPAGNQDLPLAELDISYALGRSGAKTVVFDESEIRVAVDHAGAFAEQLPLLVLPTDEVRQDAGRIELRRGGTRLLARWTPATNPIIEHTDLRAGDKDVLAVAVPGRDSLRYRIEIHPSTHTDRTTRH